jgi:hypothetical protein
VNIKIFDDLIPKYLQDYFELNILGQTSAEDKVIHPTIDFRCKYESTAIDGQKHPLSFVHILKSSTGVSPHLANFGLIPQAVCEEERLSLHEIMVARIYLTMPYDTKLSYCAPHIDFPFQHTVVLYYVNDSDGDTVFFDKNNQIVKSVSPKKGRVIIFDGLIYHGGGIPKKNHRCIVNFDILTKEIK